MLRKAFFAYQLSFSGKWCPVILYDEDPRVRQHVNGKETKPTFLNITPIDQQFLSEDEVTISFSQLQKLYPPPLTKETSGDTTMVRPVQGFVTSQGKYFDDQKEADYYEASFELNATLFKLLVDRYGLSKDDAASICQQIIDDLWSNRKIIEEYLNARHSAMPQAASSLPVEDTGSSSRSDVQSDEG